MQQTIGFHRIESDNPIIPEIILNRYISAGNICLRKQGRQLFLCTADFREVQLVGAEDQIMDAVDLCITIRRNVNTDVAFVKEFLVGCKFCPGLMFLLQYSVLLQPLVRRIFPLRFFGVSEQLRKQIRGSGHNLRACIRGFTKVGGVVVQKQHICRA